MPNSDTDRSTSPLAALMGTDAAIDEAGTPIAGLPHVREIGTRLHAAADGTAILSIPYDTRLIGDPETGVLHGGVITTLLDTACGIAVMAARAKLVSTATLDLRIDYMRPATAGLAVRAKADCYRLTRTVAFARAVAFHEDPSDPVASAAGAFIIERAAETAR